MRLSNARYEAIKRKVVSIFKRYQICSIPISGFEIARRMGIKLIPYSALSESKRASCLEFSKDGFSVYAYGEWRIVYNDESDISYGRINFTILHEIGHIVLNHTEASELADADFFAKFAQCPPVLVDKLGLEDPISIENVFDMSYSAAQYACNYYIQVASLWWRKVHRL